MPPKTRSAKTDNSVSGETARPSGGSATTPGVSSTDVDQNAVCSSDTVDTQTSGGGTIQAFLTPEQFETFMEHQKQSTTAANIQELVQAAVQTALAQLNVNPQATTSTPDAVKAELKAFEDYEIDRDNVADTKFEMIKDHINEHEISEGQHFHDVEAREIAHEQYNQERFQAIEEKLQRLESKTVKEQGQAKRSIDAQIRRFLPNLMINPVGLDESPQAKIPPKNDAFVILGADDKKALLKFMLIQTLLIAHRVPYKFWFHSAQIYFENELAQRYNELITEGANWYDLAVMIINLQNWEMVNVLATKEYHEMQPFPGELAAQFISRYRAAVNRTVMYKSRFINEKITLLGKLLSFNDVLVRYDFVGMNNVDEFYATLQMVLVNRSFTGTAEINEIGTMEDDDVPTEIVDDTGEIMDVAYVRRYNPRRNGNGNGYSNGYSQGYSNGRPAREHGGSQFNSSQPYQSKGYYNNQAGKFHSPNNNRRNVRRVYQITADGSVVPTTLNDDQVVAVAQTGTDANGQTNSQPSDGEEFVFQDENARHSQ